jgi:hypothetical protein
MTKPPGKRRVRMWLWLPAVAIASTACVAKGITGASDDDAPPPAPTSISTWTGSWKYSTAEDRGNGVSTISFDGTATWEKDPSPDPSRPVLAGGVRHRLSAGRVHLSYRGTRIVTQRDITYTCTDEGEAEAAMDTGPVPEDGPGLPSNLDVAPDGQYVGLLYQRPTLTITRRCPDIGFVGSFPGEVRLALFIRGNLSGGNRTMRGEMPPETTGGATETGSWDFAGR